MYTAGMMFGVRLASPAMWAALAAVSTMPGCGDDGGGDSGSQGTGSAASQSSSGGGSSSSASAGSATGDGSSGGGSAGGTTTTGSPTTGSMTTATTTAPATSGPDTTAGSSGGDTTTGGDAQVVRFVVLGDTGEGNEAQYAVAQAIVEICAQRGCDWGVLTGDNFYDSGVSGVDDPQWQSKFEDVYVDTEFPIYAVLGNHDYGGAGIGVDLDLKKSDYQVQYTFLSQKWKMPSKYYGFKQDPGEFWFLDTNQVMTDPFNGDSDKQLDWFKGQVAASTAGWKIAFGHHPYISNGDHGNAGSYENIEAIPLPFVTGDNVKAFMDASICGKIDVYISGHDHNLQWLEPTCGTEFIVSGAGSKAEPLPGSNPKFFQVAETEGFMWVEVTADSFTGVFYDQTGKELYSRTIMK